MARYEVRHGVGSLRQREWDLLVGGNLYQSYAWLSFLEASTGKVQAYVMLRDEDHRLVAATPLLVWDGSEPERMRGYDLCDLMPSDRLAEWLPTLIAGARSGRHNVPLVACPDDRLGRDLVRAIHAAADALSVRSVALLYVPAPTARLVASWLPAGWQALLHGAIAIVDLDVGWTSFSDYLARLPKKRRQSARRELQVGGELHTTRLANCATDVAPLIAAVQRRHSEPVDDAKMEERLGAQAAALPDSALVFQLRLQARLQASTIAFRCGDELYVRMMGLTEDAPRGAYFVAGYYEPIRYAISEGLRRVHFGINACRPKLLRGARLVPLWSFVWSAGTSMRLRDVERRNTTERQRWRDAYMPLIGDRWSDEDWWLGGMV